MFFSKKYEFYKFYFRSYRISHLCKYYKFHAIAVFLGRDKIIFYLKLYFKLYYIYIDIYMCVLK